MSTPVCLSSECDGEPAVEVNAQGMCPDCACTECGEDNTGGEGYDGLCGECADRAEKAGRWA